jgi:transglutaminase-like putative cysteine protease
MDFAPGRNAAWIEALPEGHQGTLRTLDTMRFLARKDFSRPGIRNIISLLTAGASGRDRVQALFVFARDRIRYVEDPEGIELVRDFDHCIEEGKGDCDDKVTWLATALLAAGVPCRFVIQSYTSNFWADGWDHVYLEFYDWDQWKWIALDPTADGHTGVIAEIGWRQALPPTGCEMRFEV